MNINGASNVSINQYKLINETDNNDSINDDLYIANLLISVDGINPSNLLIDDVGVLKINYE